MSGKASRRSASRPLASPSEAEAWTAGHIGQRGTATAIRTINPDQRGPVRWWLRCCGVDGSIVKALTTDAMLRAWNDTSDLQLASLRSAGPAIPTPDTNDNDDEPDEDAPAVMLNLIHKQEAPQAPRLVPAVSAPAGDLAAAAAAFAAAVAAQQTQAKPLDPEEVRALIQEEMAKHLDAIVSAPRALAVTIGAATHTLPRAPRHPMLPILLTMAANAHLPGALCPYLVGPAGSGKTTACEQVAQAMGRSFYTLGALSGAHELMGYQDAAGIYHATPFRHAFEHGGVFLLDEADRSDPAALIALNSALANGFAGFPDSPAPVRRHADFVCVVAANTHGNGSDRVYVGANQLDGATLDRFAMLDWPYDEALERALTGLDAWTAYVQAARAVCTAQKIRHIISPRASMGGAIYLRAGLDFETVANLTVWKGLAPEATTRIIQAMPASVVRQAQAWAPDQQVAA